MTSNNFKKFVRDKNLFSPADTILLGISGGVDSVVMAYIFKTAGYRFSIAHCNFQLRGDESNDDEMLVRELAKKYEVPFHCKRFDTVNYAKDNKLSLQMAARELRYNWFEELRNAHGYCCIAVATHKDDEIETMLINLTRGTGIAGLHGIMPKQGNVIRPMLFATRAVIERYAKKYKLPFRNDSSNLSDKYIRNKLRNHIVPVLMSINPGLKETMARSIEHFRDVETIYRNAVEKQRMLITEQRPDGLHFSLEKLKKIEPLRTYLYEFLRPYNFKEDVVEQIETSLDGVSGKQFFSSSHCLIKDREALIVFPLQQPDKLTGIIHRGTRSLNVPLKLVLKVRNAKDITILKSPDIAYLDYSLLDFPLIVRRWQKGDRFVPVGMKGRKKISDFLIDSKVPLHIKDNIFVLITAGGEIVWIVGLRIDDRFKVTGKTKKVLSVILQTGHFPVLHK